MGYVCETQVVRQVALFGVKHENRRRGCRKSKRRETGGDYFTCIWRSNLLSDSYQMQQFARD